MLVQESVQASGYIFTCTVKTGVCDMFWYFQHTTGFKLYDLIRTFIGTGTEGGSGSSVLATAPLPASTDSSRITGRIILPAAACGPIPERGTPLPGAPRRPWPARRHVRRRLDSQIRRPPAWGAGWGQSQSLQFVRLARAVRGVASGGDGASRGKG